MKFNRRKKFDFCYYGQVNSVTTAKIECSFEINTFGVPFILLAMVHIIKYNDNRMNIVKKINQEVFSVLANDQ